MHPPELEDYEALFALYGPSLDTVFLETDVERYRFLFEQLMRLLARGSAFNTGLPAQFVRTAQRYMAGDPRTVRSLEDPDTRLFLLSDIHDYIRLAGRAGARGSA